MVDLRILSLGAGVQSTTLALMIELGEVPMVDCGIFADTMGEPKIVYEHLDWLEQQLSFPVHRVFYRNLRQDILDAVDGKYKFMSVPFYTINSKTGKKGILRRTCTADYKIDPIIKKIREMLDYSKGQRVKKGTEVEMLMGISKNEMIRMRRNKLAYIQNVYPLIDMGFHRYHCLRWMEEHDYPKPPRSACTFCPFHSNEEWRDIKKNEEEWNMVVKMDDKIRFGSHIKKEDPVFIHKDCVPMGEADLDPNKDQQDLFNDICDEGMCGV